MNHLHLSDHRNGSATLPPSAPLPAAREGGRQQPPYVLERGQRLSRSLLWRLQRNFFERQGIEAWRRATVPHYITNNPFIARAYAQVAAAWLRDHLAAGLGGPPVDRRRPVYLLELGAGCGRFAFLFLKQLRKICRASPLHDFPFRYVMTDFAERNLDYWRGHAWLRPFVEEGTLDFALYDAEGAQPLRLRHSGQVLSAGSVHHPMIVLANYFFDGIPQDLFAVRRGKLHELLLTLSSNREEPDRDDPALLDHLQLSYEEREVAPPYYDQAVWNRILEDYRRRLPETTLSFPTTALRCLRGLQELSRDRLLVLTADRGYCREEDLAGREDPKLAVHGSFSLEVNYHALGQYCLHQGGQVFHPSSPSARLPVSAFLFGLPPGGAAETARAYAGAVDGFGPDDFFALKKGVEKMYDALSLEQLLAYLRLSDWDPNVLAGCCSALLGCLANASPAQKREVFRAAHRVWEYYFPIGEETDLAFHLGTLLHALDYYPEAITFYEHSRALHGPTALTSYNLGACHHRLRQLGPALRCLEVALEIDPDFEQARALRVALRAELNRN